MTLNKPIILCVLDGWGISQEKKYNAIYEAQPEFYNYLLKNYPYSKLETSGEAVGLPKGQMGNSEVGHMTIGSGKIIKQDLLKISTNLEEENFFKQNIYLQNLINKLKSSHKTCHIIGLTSNGGVHSHIDHAIKITSYLLQQGIKVNFHMICDGRDTSPKSAINELSQLSIFLQNPNFTLATITGRYYAMDRDKRYDRSKLAYDAIISAKAQQFSDPFAVIQNSYDKGIYDEFIEPQIQQNYKGMEDGDGIIFFNFRPDRMRQIVSSILLEEFKEFPIKKINFSSIITMTDYSPEFSDKVNILFKKESIENPLGKILSTHKLTQLRIAETEKYPHITYFFDGGREEILAGEERILIPSPQVATYDLKPEMSAENITQELLNKAKDFDFILVNFANTDMVGHTGNYEATIKAVKTIDKNLQTLYEYVVNKLEGTILLTADHGNAETMFDKKNNQPLTSHTTNPVPFFVINKNLKKRKIGLIDGCLYDIAPTILEIFKIAKPMEMIGKSLIRGN